MKTVRRKADAIRRKKDFINVQNLLILATLTVGIVDSEQESFVAIVVLSVVAAGLAAYTYALDPFAFFERFTQSIFVVIDTTLVFGVMLAVGVGQSVSIPFFVTVMAAAMLEKPLFLAPAVLLIGLLSVILTPTPIFEPASAVARLVLIMATAVFYWFVVISEREIELQDHAPEPVAKQ